MSSSRPAVRSPFIAFVTFRGSKPIMSTTSASGQSIPWWKEPTKDQWFAWWAAWMGWTLDAFDFTVFLLIMQPIAQ